MMLGLVALCRVPYSVPDRAREERQKFEPRIETRPNMAMPFSARVQKAGPSTNQKQMTLSNLAPFTGAPFYTCHKSP